MSRLSKRLSESEILALTLVEGRQRGLARPGFQRFARKHPAFRRRLKGVIRAAVNGGNVNEACAQAYVTAVRCVGHKPKGGRR